MKVFISWSGERSKMLAMALHEWLPLILHYVEPWLSEADISAGERWAQEVANKLEDSHFGIICVTPENLGAPWVLFEAGALAKSMQDGAKVIPLLFDLEFSDISGPLAQFQAKKVEKKNLKEVVDSINEAGKVPTGRVDQLFAFLWAELEQKLQAIPPKASEKKTRPQEEILEELVTTIRGLDSRLQELEEGIVKPRKGTYRSPPRPHHIKGLSRLLANESEEPVLPFLIGSFFREVPWFHELCIETSRTLRSQYSPERKLTELRLLERATDSGFLRDEIARFEDSQNHFSATLELLSSFLKQEITRFQLLVDSQKHETTLGIDDIPF